MFNNIYKGKKVFVTGYRGFCGSWLSLWLTKLGAKVYGCGHLPNTDPNHYDLLPSVAHPVGMELLDYPELEGALTLVRPDLIIHLAAKAIVARTFKEPRKTFENNIMGAVNILDAARCCENLKGIVMVVTDKVYDNREWHWGYREVDTLKGDDPYSVSKVCVDQITDCYRKCFGLNVAVARAGNVIGGGDWSYKRLIPDIVRATAVGEPVIIHTPTATRPFQHVLDALNGYLVLGQKIMEGEDVNRAWNFGPDESLSVLDILTIAKRVWPDVEWKYSDEPTHPNMVYLLRLDTTESKKLLNWKPVWSIKRAVIKSISWYKHYYRSRSVFSESDITDFEAEVSQRNA